MFVIHETWDGPQSSCDIINGQVWQLIIHVTQNHALKLASTTFKGLANSCN